MGKYVAVAILGLAILAGVGFAVYKLTNLPEQAEEWWDEKKLDNFETLANRELDEQEAKLEQLEKDLQKYKTERILWAGAPELGEQNMVEQKTRFKTVLGYDRLIAYRTKQGEALAAAYKAEAAKGANIDANGDLDPKFALSVDLPQMPSTVTGDFKFQNQAISAGAVINLLGEIETDLAVLEKEREGAAKMVEQYDALIANLQVTVKESRDALKQARQDVKLIAAEIKIKKATEGLEEINKGIQGKGGNSEIGKMIANYNKKKSEDIASKLANAETKSKSTSLADLDKPASGGSKTSGKSSRFLK